MGDETARGARGPKEAAEYLGLSLRSIYNLIAAGKLKSFTVGSRRLFSTTELDRFIREAEAASNEEAA